MSPSTTVSARRPAATRAMGSKVGFGVLGSVDDDRVAQLVGAADALRELGVDLRGHANLDADDAAGESLVEESRDLEPADSELLRDLGFGPTLEVVAAGDGSRADPPVNRGIDHLRDLAHLSRYSLILS